MPRNEQDPAASTQQFRAFASNGETQRQGPKTALIVGLGVVVVIALIAVFLIV
jgi:hypothetical protein